jgi:hypothetical protein
VEIKISEIQHGSLRIVRRCRIVTYVMGLSAEGKDEIVAEVSEEHAQGLLRSIAEGQTHERSYPGAAEETAASNVPESHGTAAYSH